MTDHYAYDIATTDADGRWTVNVNGADEFSRDPVETARSLLERWIHEHYGRIAGGSRVFVLTAQDAEQNGVVPNVRVRVFRTRNGNRHTRSLAAIAYLARVESDHDSTDRRNGRVGRWRLRWEYRRYLVGFPSLTDLLVRR